MKTRKASRTECCSNCGSPARVARKDYVFREMGIPVVMKNIEVIECAKCGNVDPVIVNLDGLMHGIALSVIVHDCKLTGDEFRFLRKYAGRTQEEFGQLLHVDKTHISKMETGQVAIGDQTDRLVRFIVLNSSPELRDKASRLLQSLPLIAEDCHATKPRLQVDAKTMEAEYAY